MLLTADCHVYCADVEGIVHDAVISEQMARHLVAPFELSLLSERAGDYADSRCDAPDDVFWFDDVQVAARATCGDSPPEPAWLKPMRSALTLALNSCPSGRVRWNEDMRYTLIEEEPNESLDLVYANAVRWPLEVGERSVATPRWGENYDKLAARHVARGADATTLRELQRRLKAGEFGHDGIRFTPIEEPGGRRYQLWMGDSIPLEDDNGLLPFARPGGR